MTLAALVLLAQLYHPCNPLSSGNGTLYVHRDNGAVSCMEWNQAVCNYVERQCAPAELAFVCEWAGWCEPEPIVLLPPPRHQLALLPMRRIDR
jgi:hypothetical protein